nr:MAG TPA: hypothetical protein [Caudoviricetes sp.]
MVNPNNRQNRKQRRATGTGKKKRNNQPRNQNRSNPNPQHQWEQEPPRFNPNPAPTNYFPGYGNQQQPAQLNNGAYSNQHGAPGGVNDNDFGGNFPAEAVTDPEPVIEEYYEDEDDEDSWGEDAPPLKDFSKMLPASTLGIYTQALMLSEELGPLARGLDSKNLNAQSMEAMHKSVTKAQEMVLENAEDRAEMQEFLESLSLNDGIAFIMEKFTEILESLGN